VDLAKLAPEDIDADWVSRSVRLRAPAPEIFSATLDNERTHVVTRATDTLATRREDLEGMARREAESRLRSAATEAGILTRAADNGERAVESLLRSLGYQQVQVTWKS
jgi:delta 1-pyrroline-5-carboxylate dehydrogenase